MIQAKEKANALYAICEKLQSENEAMQEKIGVLRDGLGKLLGEVSDPDGNVWAEVLVAFRAKKKFETVVRKAHEALTKTK